MNKIENDRQLKITRQWIRRSRRARDAWHKELRTTENEEQWFRSGMYYDVYNSEVGVLLNQVSIYLKQRSARPYIKYHRIRFRKTNS